MGVKVREKVKGSRVWWVFVNHNGRRKAKQVGDRKAADQVASEIRKRLAAGDFQLPKDGPRFAQVAEEWLAKYPLVNGISKTTLENYASFTRTHLIPYFGERPVSSIGVDAVEDFIAAKRSPGGSARFKDKPLSEAAVRSGLIALRLILNRAVKAGILPANPARGVGRFPRHDEQTVDAFAVAELRSLLAAAQQHNPDFATLLRVWAQTGMRAGEVRSLQWGDLDLERGLAVVQRTHSRGRIGPPKTRQARTVSLLHPVAEDTTEWKPGSTLESRAVLTALRRLRVQSLDPEAHVFVQGNGKAWDSASVLRAWKRALRAAEVRYRPPEQFRHGWASILLSRNAPILYVQRQGGWRSAAVLLRVYARWMPQEVEIALGARPAAPSATQAQPAPVEAAAR